MISAQQIQERRRDESLRRQLGAQLLTAGPLAISPTREDRSGFEPGLRAPHSLSPGPLSRTRGHLGPATGADSADGTTAARIAGMRKQGERRDV